MIRMWQWHPSMAFCAISRTPPRISKGYQALITVKNRFFQNIITWFSRGWRIPLENTIELVWGNCIVEFLKSHFRYVTAYAWPSKLHIPMIRKLWKYSIFCGYVTIHLNNGYEWWKLIFLFPDFNKLTLIPKYYSKPLSVG